MSSSIRLQNVSVTYSTPGGKSLLALGAVSLTIEPGTFVSLVGPSGSGKSTLLRVMGGLLKASKGEALLDGNLVKKPSTRVGMMFQEANLMPWRNVRDNIALPLELDRQPKSVRYAAVEELLPILGLVSFADSYPGELSGGMAQRVALGRVLVQQPDVLLLDEPFGALDALTREQVSGDLLRIWANLRQTVVMVTHDINEAVWLSDRVIVFSPRPGRIIRDINVNLPRPRLRAMTYSEAFGALAVQVREAIEFS
ncbi:MAG: ABC transporter ATP-binding protein [Phototrophicaceae bacterium]|jgi:NitT/TauT family transport system ATP-binding protein